MRKPSIKQTLRAIASASDTTALKNLVQFHRHNLTSSEVHKVEFLEITLRVFLEDVALRIRHTHEQGGGL